jgi:hypothetical protein
MADRPGRRRKVQKKWIVRIADSERATDTGCALCNKRASLIPIASRFSEPGLVERTWRPHRLRQPMDHVKQAAAVKNP